ncbi:MAG: glycoside hydrolase family 1 protein [Candidatus Moraniibacteriota bacterium]|nr:MAG: glycoside hydrolase family 1 protein [Candidatus Moranbacteria bacterium]
MIRQFPEGFLWGAATASHQVEGGNTNDWSEWEAQNASRLAKKSTSEFGHLPGWTEKFGTEAARPENYISGVAVDHYHRYEEDFDIAKELGHTASRFSIEWSRVEPQEGVWNEEEIVHYQTVVRALRARNIEPFVTLWHWTLPLWLREQGGMLAPKFPEYFARYAKKVAIALGNDVTFWITLNEPDVVTGHAYIKAQWPPQERGLLKYIRANFALIKAHRSTYSAIKQHNPNAHIGIAKHQLSFELKRNTFVNRTLKLFAHYFWNKWFLNRVKDTQDFVGLNHYGRCVIDNGLYKNPNERRTDIGWEFYPESIYQALTELKPYGKPIYITENGLADRSDTLRQEFLTRALASVHRAIEDGAEIKGYLHWSLLDNFEWDKGFWPCFGLIAVDRTTQNRTVRESARYYAKICHANELETTE